jgi:hypothetical protein
MRVYTRATAADAWVERDVGVDGVRVSDEVNARSTATVRLVDSTGALLFDRGQGVKVTRDSEDVFRGFVINAEESRLGLDGTRVHTLDCVDLHYLLDKRIITDAYQDTTAGDIVLDILTTHLAGEGITTGTIQDGPTIRAITFDYQTIADAVSKLAERSGFWWRVNPDGTLDFAEPLALVTAYAGSTGVQAGTTSVNAGAEATGTATTVNLDTVALADSISVSRHATGYRNRQWIRGGRAQTTVQVETQYGDGERRAFAVGFPIAVEPTIEISRNGGPWTVQTLGVAGLQTDRQWSWARGSVTLQQASTETVLTSVDRVRVTYTGLFDIIVKVEDEPAQTSRALVEGGTGIVEKVKVDARIDEQEEAVQYGGQLLDYWTRSAITVRLATSSTTFAPGQTALFTLDEAALDAVEGLVTSVEHYTSGGRERQIVTVAIGPQEGSWAAWFGHLSRRVDEAFQPRGGEAEVVTTVESFSKTWTEAERPNIFVETHPGASTYPGSTTIPMFDIDERVTHLAWIRDGVEIGRKPFTLQAGADSTEIVTTTVLVASDAVGEIDELAWYGGHLATNESGSGVEVDRQAFVTTKTDIEQIQVVKTDTKWS